MQESRLRWVKKLVFQVRNECEKRETNDDAVKNEE